MARESMRQACSHSPIPRSLYWMLSRREWSEGSRVKEALTLQLLAEFLGEPGRAFYGEPNSKETITVGKEKTGKIVDALLGGEGEFEVMPFRRCRSTDTLNWS